MTKKCKHKFKYKNTIKAIWSFKGYQDIKCEVCNQVCKITNISRLVIAIIDVLPILTFNFFINHLGNWSIIIYLVYIAFIILISPFIVKFCTKIN